MPDLTTCLSAAVKDKTITDADAQRVKAMYHAFRRRAEAEGNYGMAGPEARRLTEEWLAAETAHEKRKAKRAIATIRQLAADLDSFRTPNNQKDIGEAALAVLENDGGKIVSVAQRRKVITAQAHAQMESLLYQFRRGNFGGDLTRHNRAQLTNVVRELFGEDTGDLAAKGLAETWTATAETLRKRFNDAGGAIGKLENWGLPQRHDPEAVFGRGKEGWIETIKPMLAPERMRHPLTGMPVLPEELDAILDDMWGRIATNGINEIEPKRLPFGKGALANQHAEHRFLVFKDADTWLAYQREFGGGRDPFATMMAHVSMMARDIAAMEVLGPNPQATVEWLKQVVMKEAALKREGKPSRFAGTAQAAEGRATKIVDKIDNLWADLRGTLNTPVSETLAAWAGGARSIITSAVLGSATLSSLGDTATAATTMHFATGAGSTPMGIAKDMIYALTPTGSREAIAAGLIQDSALNVFHQQARYVGNLQGPGWASFIADRVLTLSLLTPWTRGAKHAFGMGFMHEVAKQQGKSWDKLHPFFRDTFTRFGIRENDWSTFTIAKVHQTNSGLTMLRPPDIAVHNKATAERYHNMILSLTTLAVPDSTHRSRIAWIGGTRAGTGRGELLRSISQFKTFATVFAMLHGREVARRAMGGEIRTAAAYATTLLIGTTLMGGLSMQLVNVASGRDPQPMNTKEFWGAALLRGGGLGIYGDFLFADVNRYGGGLAGSLSGPLIEKSGDLINLTIGNAIELSAGKETNFGREAVKFLRGNVPGANVWYMRAALDRLLFDQLQYLVDPEANTAFKRSMAATARTMGTGFWWEKGKGLPSRAPNLGNALGAAAP